MLTGRTLSAAHHLASLFLFHHIRRGGAADQLDARGRARQRGVHRAERVGVVHEQPGKEDGKHDGARPRVAPHLRHRRVAGWQGVSALLLSCTRACRLGRCVWAALSAGLRATTRLLKNVEAYQRHANARQEE